MAHRIESSKLKETDVNIWHPLQVYSKPYGYYLRNSSFHFSEFSILNREICDTIISVITLRLKFTEIAEIKKKNLSINKKVIKTVLLPLPPSILHISRIQLTIRQLIKNIF